ncbi:hypothetical protein GE107_17145 [Cohnella sp. CFH 77786]|uniref:C40 family peptidase n=1 Tax=Cohnella sp. CFH 77786 TaxID=2662265 RepID=UPI001C610375|nr:C40 family peptidase [Cohnella sp. CFH 77786]MBW5447783.1 hypothetical protein [Cohnella sp. CFH 77786]
MRHDLKRMAREAARKGGIFAAMAGLLAGCVTNPGDTQNLKQHGGTNRTFIKSKAESEANRAKDRSTVPVRTVHNSAYVALSDVAAAAGFHGAWLKDGRTYGIGDHDPIWKFRVGESRFTKAGKSVRLPAPAVREQGRLLVPASALDSMFGRVNARTSGTQGITFLPRATGGETGADGSSLPFSDAIIAKEAVAGQADAIVAYAKEFLGVPYEFGADPYPASQTFDCSSFVQQVYGHFGIRLPRSSQEQAAEGAPVSRDALMAGDLLFFHIPSRSKSPDVVGHVGMYIGNGQMIHASPSPQNGVQITDINNPFYLREFLYAKRVLP